MSPAENTMLQEALSAMQKGERWRARDLLTRMLKSDPNNAQYWVWMSATVETAKERQYCLKEALKIDPQNEAARRGLALMGVQTTEKGSGIPWEAQKRSWQTASSGPNAAQMIIGPSWKRWTLYAGAAVLAVALLGVGIFGLPRLLRASQPQAAVIVRRTLTPAPTATLAAQSRITTTAEPASLAKDLAVNYTPTPLYVNTPHPVSEAYRVAVRAYERKDWGAVIANMQQVAELEPQAADAYYFIGEAYRFQNNSSKALAAYGDALKINKDFAPAYLGRARLRLAGTPPRLRDALTDLEKAVELDPQMGEAYLELANAALLDDNPEEALTQLKEAERLLPDSPVVYYLRGEAALALGQNEQALESAQKASQLDITLLPAYRLLGQALQVNGKLSESIETLTTYVQYAPKDAEALAWLGAAYAADGNAAKALETFEQALRIDERAYPVYVQRGELYLQEKNGQAALDDFNSALRWRSSDYRANLGQGRAYLLLDSSGDAYIQFVTMQKYARTDAQRGELYYWRAQAMELVGETRAAIKDWQALLALPTEATQAAWRDTAVQHLAVLITPTPTSEPVTATPTRIVTATRTPKPSQTPRQSSTPAASPTPTPTP